MSFVGRCIRKLAGWSAIQAHWLGLLSSMEISMIFCTLLVIHEARQHGLAFEGGLLSVSLLNSKLVLSGQV